MISTDLLDKIARGISQTEYSLLLGAGASLGAVGGNGSLLPTGSGLRDALIEHFGVDTGNETPSLAAAYDYVQRRYGERVNKYLYEWFSGCRPSWQHLFAEFNWNRIWTLNIDDVIETAFSEQGRPVESLTWNERFSEPSYGPRQQVIYLHGIAGRLLDARTAEDILIFALSDYIREVANPRTWHKVFTDSFAGNPFLIIGAQLTEEIDLVETLGRGSAAYLSTGFPSVIVVPSITTFRRDQLEAAGFTIIENDGETFFVELLERYRLLLSEFGDVFGYRTPGLMKFQQQFINLRSYEPHGKDAGDFYSGYQPTWKTISSNDDAMIGKTNQAFDEIVNLATDETIRQKIVFLTGSFGTGKSTGLLRIGERLKGAGTHPFLFRADEYMDIDATMEWLKTVPRTVLLFDDFGDHSSTLQRLSERCDKEGVRLVLVGSDRSTRRPLIHDRIAAKYLNRDESYWYGNLSDGDVDRLLAKLHSRGRLGHITRWNEDEQRRYFTMSANRRLFDAMAELENGIGFRETAQKVYDALPTESMRELYAACCLCYDQSIPLPIGIASGLVGMTPKDLVDLIENKCSGVLVLTRVGIRPPHRVTANLVVQNVLDLGERSRISLALARSLAPHVDERAMRSGTREYRIVRHLMNHQTVARISGAIGGRDWYENLLSSYDWNGRYWDQRALFESQFGEHETARSYAERSIQVHPHPFGYNTLGTVLLRMAISRGVLEALDNGIENLERAKGFRDWGPREHPFTAFFTSLIRYAGVWGIAAIPPQVRNTWNQWYREAQSSQMFSTQQGQEQLIQWHREWLAFAVPS